MINFFSFRKKGELTIEYIIVLILALIVLVTLGIIFRSQIVSFISKITGLSDSVMGFNPIE